MLQAAESAAECIAWSPDSRFLLSCGKGSDLIQLWDIAVCGFIKRWGLDNRD